LRHSDEIRDGSARERAPATGRRYRASVTSEPDHMLLLIDEATDRLLTTVRGFSDDDVRQPSSLRGWTRGHVLTHLARGGDAIRNLLDGVRTGVPGTAYASQQARDEAIERGAGRGAAELLVDLTESAAAFRAAAESVSADAWGEPVRAPTGDPFPARQLLERRLVELELHSVDLDAGYTAGDWPEEFAGMDLVEPMRSQREERRRRSPRSSLR
jgi:maleylpyruvate isomerase